MLQTTILTSLLSILLVVLTVVGIQTFLLLEEFRQTLRKINQLSNSAENKINALVQPLRQLSTAAVGLQTGMKAIEAVVEWIADKKSGESVVLAAKDTVKAELVKPGSKVQSK